MATANISDFMNGRKMEVKMNQHSSKSHDLIGGSPQGSILGQLLYIIGSDDVAEQVPEEDKYKYIDDLAVLDAVNIKVNLREYDFLHHVPSDIPPEQRFLAPSTFKSQGINDQVSEWTIANKMKINEGKSKYIIFSRSKEDFATRLTMNGQPIERVEELIHLGVWISSDLSWDKHVSELCRRAYPRVRMLTKLKYVGVPIEDLIELYCLFVRSLTECCNTLFHSSLSLKLQN